MLVADAAGEELFAGTFAHDEAGLRALCRSLVRLNVVLARSSGRTVRSSSGCWMLGSGTGPTKSLRDAPALVATLAPIVYQIKTLKQQSRRNCAPIRTARSFTRCSATPTR